MRPVVLVHGAWHGPWCWERVTPHLDAAGVPWHAPELVGPDLHADAARVRAVLDDLDDVVLVGHSYGGAVVTEGGAHPAVSRLVYLAALALDAGESLQSAGGEDARAVEHESPNIGDFLVELGDGVVGVAPEAVGPYLYGDCDDATVAWAMARLRPQPAAVFGDTPTAIAWRATPATYVVCTQDRAVHPDLQRILARRSAEEVVEWPVSHSPFASVPQRTAELLIGLAR